MDGTREIYIEPSAVVASGGSILIAGTPNYLWTPGSPGLPRDFVRDSVFGAVVGLDSRARLVPAPTNASLVKELRAVALPGGGWAVVFAELTRPWEGSPPDTVARLWYGVFDGKAWSSLEQLPQPGVGQLTSENMSHLIHRGDTFSVSMRFIRPNRAWDIAFFERRAGKWSVSTLNATRAAYTQLWHSDSLGLVMSIVRPDSTLRADGNSLFIYTRRPQWLVLRKLIHGSDGRVHLPRFTHSAQGSVLTWRSDQPDGRYMARALIDALGATQPRLIELDPDVIELVPVTGGTARPLWVVEHIGVPSQREMRIIADSAGSATVLARFPSPFTGLFAATAISASDFVVAGPMLRPEQPNPSLVTLLIRARLECRPGAP